MCNMTLASKCAFFWNESTQTLSGAVHWNNQTEGPANGTYGGSIAVVFDEILAYPVWYSGQPAVTANINFNIRKMIPFNTSARFESKIVKSEGKKRFLEAVITTADGKTKYADAKGLWIISTAAIGGSSATQPETRDMDRNFRKVNDLYVKDVVSAVETSSNVLSFPMNASVNVKSAVRPEERLPPQLEAPNGNNTLPYQHHIVEHSLVGQFAPQFNENVLKVQPPQPRTYETTHNTIVYAKL